MVTLTSSSTLISRLRRIELPVGEFAVNDLASYGDLLERLYGFYAPLEGRWRRTRIGGRWREDGGRRRHCWRRIFGT